MHAGNRNCVKIASKPILIEEAEDVKVVEFKFEDGSCYILQRQNKELMVHVISK